MELKDIFNNYYIVGMGIMTVVICTGVGVLTRNLKVFSEGKRQLFVELVVEKVNDIVDENMGLQYRGLAPFIGTLFIVLSITNLIGLFGLKPLTSNISVTLGFALISFGVIQGYTIKESGIKKYLKGFIEPIPVLLPMNIIERIALPTSLCLRLFGNVFAATIIVELIYELLGEVSWVLTLGVPIPFHLYFDVFDGLLQMVIFIMLTMINIKLTYEH